MTSDISTLVSSKKYHTVSIRGTLSKTQNDYKNQLPQELPPESFWITEVILSNVPASIAARVREKISTARYTQYKHLYSKANGPCKSLFLLH